MSTKNEKEPPPPATQEDDNPSRCGSPVEGLLAVTTEDKKETSLST